MVFQITATDASAQLNQSDFAYDVNTSIPYVTNEVIYSHSESLIRIRFTYSESLEGEAHSLTLNFDPSKVSTPAVLFEQSMSGSNYQLTFEESPATIETYYLLSMVVSGLIVVLFFVMVAADQKLPATELLLSAQMVYFALFTAGNNIGIAALRGLQFLNGFNAIQTFEVDLLNYRLSEVQSMGVFKEFILNFNLMGVLQLLSIALMLPFKMRVWKFERQKDALMDMTFDADLKANFLNGVPTVSQTRH